MVHAAILADSWYSFPPAPPVRPQDSQVIKVALSPKIIQLPARQPEKTGVLEEQPDPQPVKPLPELESPAATKSVSRSDQIINKSKKEVTQKTKLNHPPKRQETSFAIETAPSETASDEPTKMAESEMPEKDELEAKAFEHWLARLQQAINIHREYPYQARRRNITGRIQAIINVKANGMLTSVNILSGNKIFYKSTRKAIEASFPMPPLPRGEAQAITVTVQYSLH